MAEPQFHRPLARRAGDRACSASASMTLITPLDAHQGRRRDRHRAQHVLRRGHCAAFGHSAADRPATRPGSTRTCSAKRPASTRHDIAAHRRSSPLFAWSSSCCCTRNSSCFRSITDFATAQGWPTLALDLADDGHAGRRDDRRPADLRRDPDGGADHPARRGGPLLDEPPGRLLCDRRALPARRPASSARFSPRRCRSDGSASRWSTRSQVAAGAAHRAVCRGDFLVLAAVRAAAAASSPALSPSCACSAGSSANICCARCTN